MSVQGYRVRLAHIDEISSLSELEKAASAYPWSRSDLRSSQNAEDQILVLEIEQDLAGYAVFRVTQDEAELLNLVIAKPFQGDAWGLRLLQHCLLEHCSVGIAECVFLEVRASNERAIRLYQRLGFKQTGMRKNYYPVSAHQREDAILMRWQSDK